MRRKLPVLAFGLTLAACGKPATIDAETGSAAADLALSVRCVAEEVSKDSSTEDVQISLDGSALTYKRSYGGFGAEHAAAVDTTVSLSGDEIALVKEWIAEGRLMEITALDDRSAVDPGPYHRRRIDIGIELGGERHEFGLYGVDRVKGSATPFGQRDDVGRAELFVDRLTDLVREKRAKLFEPRR